MSEAVKKLTVSYGAFSCTLEGFDDPFPVMKMVVDYFQSLAERDPSFGAHPERPDADYLRNLAQRGTNQNVEIETQENGVILRQTFETMPETADAVGTSRGANLSLVPRREPAEGAAVMAADYADEMFTSIESNDFPSEMQRAFQDQPQVASQPPSNDPSSVYDREERALERLLNAARLRSGTEQTLAPANPMSQIKEALHEQMDSHLFDDAAPLEALPDSDLVTELVEPELEKVEMIGIGTLPVSEPETPQDHQSDVETHPAPESGVPDSSDDAELTDSNGTLAMTEAAETSQDTAVEMPETVAADATLHAVPDEATLDLEEPSASVAEHIAETATETGSTLDVAPEMLADLMTSQTEPLVKEDSMRGEDARVAATDIPAHAEDFAVAGLTLDVEAPFVSVVEHVVEAASAPGVSPEMLADATTSQPELPVETDIAHAEETEVAATDDPAEFDWNGGRAQQVEDSLAAQDIDDETAAVAAALQRGQVSVPVAMSLLVLGPALMVVSGDEAVLEEVETSDDQSDQNQDAAARRHIVRTRPEVVDFDYSAETRRAPAEPAFPGEARPSARSEDFDEAIDADDTGITLDNFARKVGAASLPELLEASAAYVTIVSGQPRFSRASILNMVDELSNERSYTQEARIKSFGKLLRNGSILRVEDGKFAISHSAKFNYEVKISA